VPHGCGWFADWTHDAGSRRACGHLSKELLDRRQALASAPARKHGVTHQCLSRVLNGQCLRNRMKFCRERRSCFARAASIFRDRPHTGEGTSTPARATPARSGDPGACAPRSLSFTAFSVSPCLAMFHFHEATSSVLPTSPVRPSRCPGRRGFRRGRWCGNRLPYSCRRSFRSQWSAIGHRRPE